VAINVRKRVERSENGKEVSSNGRVVKQSRGREGGEMGSMEGVRRGEGEEMRGRLREVREKGRH